MRVGSPSQSYCPAGKSEQSNHRAPRPRFAGSGTRKRVQLAILKASTEREIDAPLATLVEMHADGLVVAGDPFILSRRDKLLALASRHALPAIYPIRAWAEGAVLSAMDL